MLLVAGAVARRGARLLRAPAEAQLAPLDTGAVDQATATLFGRDGSRFTAALELPAGNDNTECRVWPLRNVARAASRHLVRRFRERERRAIPLDSVDALPARDSMALAAEASRLASTVTANTSPAFQGLRFTAHDIRRFEIAPGVQGLAAHLIRQVNQEANPQEEQTLLIAERDSGAATGPYQLAYAERSFGKEEAGEHERGGRGGSPRFDVAHRRSSSLAMATNGLAYALLERTGPHQWRVRWTSGSRSAAVRFAAHPASVSVSLQALAPVLPAHALDRPPRRARRA